MLSRQDGDFICVLALGGLQNKYVRAEFEAKDDDTVKVKVKAMFNLEQPTKAQRGNRGRALHFL
jgi:hypothetical protein